MTGHTQVAKLEYHSMPRHSISSDTRPSFIDRDLIEEMVPDRIAS
jgi:hypothetical protein